VRGSGKIAVPVSRSRLAYRVWALGTLETLPFQLDAQSRLRAEQIQFGTIPILGMRTSTHFFAVLLCTILLTRY